MTEIQIFNKMEKAVEAYLFEFERDGGLVCDCERCKLDIRALTLNSLPPKYVVTDLGEVVTNVNLDSTQWRADIMVAVHQAQEIVKKRPRHK